MNIVKNMPAKAKSTVWEHFKKETQADGTVVGVCKHCQAHRKFAKNSSSNLKHHLEICKEYNKEAAPGQKTLELQGKSGLSAREEKEILAVVFNSMSFRTLSEPHFRAAYQPKLTRNNVVEKLLQLSCTGCV